LDKFKSANNDYDSLFSSAKKTPGAVENFIIDNNNAFSFKPYIFEAVLKSFEKWKEDEAKVYFLLIIKQIEDCLGFRAKIDPDESYNTFKAIINYKEHCKIEIITFFLLNIKN
jgi:hypothetical protein